MSLPRFFVDDLALDASSAAGAALELRGDQAHHAAKVLRMKKGEALVLCQSDGYDYICEVEQAGAEVLALRYLRRQDNRAESLPQLVLWQGLPKGAKFAEIIEKSVELGVHRIVPLQSSRSLIKLEEKNAQAKQARWQKIAAAAAKQCGRGLIPEIALPCSMSAALSEIQSDMKRTQALAFIPWEEALEPNLVTYIQSAAERLASLERLHFFIGPEGGFSQAEISAAATHGVSSVSLGRRILRTETAGPAVLAMLSVLLPQKML